MWSSALPLKPTTILLPLPASSFSSLNVPVGLDNTGVSLPYLSIKTTPSWYSLNVLQDFITPLMPDSGSKCLKPPLKSGKYLSPLAVNKL